MGSGKTTVGRIVADALGCVFLDLDSLVESREKKSVAEIFRTGGEEAFRRAEEEALAFAVRKYSGGGDLVLALGGGAVLSPKSRRLLRELTTCIWLQAPAEELLRRTAGSAERPLADENFVSRLSGRLSLYEEVSQAAIDTSGLSPEDVADEIIISCL